jgi:FkbM family methyltransferase
MLLGRRAVLISLNKTWHFKVRDLYDILAIKEVFDESVYLPIFRKLKRDTTLIDIGGYIGDVAIYAKQFRKIKEVITIEPLPDNQELLKFNLKINKVKNVLVIKAAVSDRNGSKKFYIHPNKGQSSFFKYSDNVTNIRVKCMTLGKIISLVRTSNLILKCDSEGTEYEIFLNTPLKLLSRFDGIIFEYHNDKKMKALTARLEKAGFSVKTKKHPVEPNLGIAFAYPL